jgi:uncharacterized protein (TIGR00725 family)
MAAELGVATVGVMGSGRHEHDELAEPLGGLIASLELNLLTGAGGGVMSSVGRAYRAARRGRGIAIGIVPCASLDVREEPREGYPNDFVELPIFTHLPLSGDEGVSDLSRNHINVLSSDLIVALPGGAGTRSELELALRYAKPVIAFAAEPAQIADFPPAIARAFELSGVEAFIGRSLAVRQPSA